MKNIFATLCVICFLFAGCEQKSTEITSQYHRDYLIVVNDEHPYDFAGEYATNLKDDLAVTKQDTTGDEEYLEYKTLQAFHDLRTEARKNDIKIGLISGYRSKQSQRWLYGDFVMTSQAETGYSEHHTGLNISIAILDYLPDGDGQYWLSEGGKIPENEELTKLLPDYGFIRRYPEGKEEYTGHAAEPYEIRYVGSPETAHYIMDNNLCLEEYLQNKGLIMACE
ncbi:D-alanyl-D-alanine carboxypeptidase family protein [Candidatus Saccharibacteria bacterium]|nr:D-alanyl-D-alanine carboxypeptidase family protein [Candidatus Saccharibacteria bacterium]